ncbi:MAG: hypothetical protein V1779_01640 [bacterium]
MLIEDLENSPQYDDECPCPNVKVTRKFYTASCGIWVNCTYDISNTQPVCEQGFDLPLPHYNDGNGDKVKVWRWQSCGQTCCERVYQVCKAPSATHPGSFVIQIQAMQKNRIAPCTQAPDGSSPKYAKPCEDGC